MVFNKILHLVFLIGLAVAIYIGILAWVSLDPPEPKVVPTDYSCNCRELKNLYLLKEKYKDALESCIDAWGIPAEGEEK